MKVRFSLKIYSTVQLRNLMIYTYTYILHFLHEKNLYIIKKINTYIHTRENKNINLVYVSSDWYFVAKTTTASNNRIINMVF